MDQTVVDVTAIETATGPVRLGDEPSSLAARAGSHFGGSRQPARRHEQLMTSSAVSWPASRGAAWVTLNAANHPSRTTWSACVPRLRPSSPRSTTTSARLSSRAATTGRRVDRHHPQRQHERHQQRPRRPTRAAFGDDWDAVREAPLAAIIDAIRPPACTTRAPAIVATLERIRRTAAADLSHLAAIAAWTSARLPDQPARRRPQDASIVVLFCFNGAAFPVDTHIQRISQRLGISGHRASPENQADLESLLPPETFYPLHINLIRHGRQICQALTPQCERVLLQADCDYFSQAGEWSTGDERPKNGAMAPTGNSGTTFNLKARRLPRRAAALGRSFALVERQHQAAVAA